MDFDFSNMMYERKIVYGFILFALGELIIFSNLLGWITTWLYKKNYSSLPWFGGIFLAIGMYLIPHPLLNRLFLIAFLVDYTWPMFGGLMIFMVGEVFWNNKEKR